MSIADGYATLELTRDRWDDIVDIDEWAFLDPWLPEQREANHDAFMWGRGSGIMVADAERGTPGELVAVRCSYPFRMMVPGGERVPASGLSWVGVHPGHRRRGLLTTMIHEHFEHALERGEYISALTASEPKIYQRFGYGLGTWQLRATFVRGTQLRAVPGADQLTVRLERLQSERHSTLMADLQRQVHRPGAIVREGEAITANLFASDTNLRPQEEPLRIAIVSTPEGVPQAFAVFRRKSAQESAGTGGSVTVFNVVTTTASAASRLWTVLFDLDLTRETTITSLPVDDPLMSLAMDQRAPQATLEDDLWLRILDVPRALEARLYEAPVDVVVRVRDDHLTHNAGLWRISTANLPGGGASYAARVTRVDERAPEATEGVDISIGIQELSSVYLGGVTVQALVEAGLVTEHTPGAARLLSAAMRSAQSPASTFHF